MSAKEQLSRERAAWRRDKDNQQRHIRAIQTELQRIRRLRPEGRAELQARLGTPLLDDLETVLWYLVDAADPLTGAPSEDTMRVNYPTSRLSEDGETIASGAATIRHRRRLKNYIRRIRRTIADIAAEYGGPPERDPSRFANHIRHHVEFIPKPSRSCEFCAGVDHGE